ncbi:MAG: type IV pilus assembly protein PilO [Gammaproteobacteria bacterium]|jgi:type IV pilus assembly protein PilO
MTFSDLQSLDPAHIGSWPGAVRALLVVAICAAVLGAGFYFVVQAQIDTLSKVEENEITIKETFEAKQRKAANLEPLKQQLVEMKQSFGAMLRLLPNKTEIEALLVDISQSGLASGLEFELFKPAAEQPAEFYAVQPINITVTGTYHEFGEFISAVAALPRIVTQHNLLISPVAGSNTQVSDSKARATPLRMSLIAKTYRYLDEDEIEAEADKGKKKGKRR